MGLSHMFLSTDPLTVQCMQEGQDHSLMMHIDWSQLPQLLQYLTDCQGLPQSLSSFSSNVIAVNTAV